MNERQAPTLNTWDRVVSWFDPTAGVRRAQARMALGLMRGYEGASVGRRTDGWRTGSKSADNEIARAGQRLRDRGRDHVRNTPQGKAIVREIANNLVGTGIMCVPRAADERKATQRRTKEIAQLWKRWARSVHSDQHGLLTFYAQQALAAKTVVMAGEVLIVRRRTRDKIPLRLMMLEPEYLDVSRDKQEQDGSRISGGIEYDADGMRTAYWLYRQHPSEALSESVRIPAKDVAHILDIERPGQSRGVSWMHAVMLRMRDFADYEDAQLLRQKIAACFVAFVQEPDGPPADSSTATPVSDKFEPAAIEKLPVGKSVTFANPPGVEGYKDYRNGVQHDIAAGAGVTYEQMTGDYSQVNYSSARMGWLAFQRAVEMWRWNMLIPMMCDRVFEWFLEAVQLTGVDIEGVECDWVPPRREMLDPTREVPATRDAVRSGLKSLSEAQRELGYEPDELLDEMAEDYKRLDALGLTLDSDPRKTAASGMAQAKPADGGDTKDGEKT